MRMIAAGAALVALVQAPLQCSHAPDPSLRREDTAGDALWSLAQDFRAKHEDAAARETLKYLLDRYPSSRYAPAAREQLGEGGEGGT
jgi:outer membrane protein assembly factor BamD (BamD/ComL family)